MYYSIMLPMAGSHPKFSVINVRRNNFLEASLSVFSSNEVNQLVVDYSSFRIEKATAWTQLMKKEQLLVLLDIKKFFNYFQSFENKN